MKVSSIRKHEATFYQDPHRHQNDKLAETVLVDSLSNGAFFIISALPVSALKKQCYDYSWSESYNELNGDHFL